jgi:hypothetical protein
MQKLAFSDVFGLAIVSYLSTVPIYRTENHFKESDTGLDFYTVKSLYPILGSQLVLMCLPFFYFYLRDSNPRSLQCDQPRPLQLREKKTEAASLGTRPRLCLLILMAVLYFLFSGMEVSFRSYISTFTVAIGNSRQTGSGKTEHAKS